MLENELSNKIIGLAIEVHNQLGAGLLESIYEECLCHELNSAVLAFERQKPLPVIYKGLHLDCGYRLDLVVEQKLIIEIKAVESILPIHRAQILTYLKLTELKLGLIINFNVPMLTNGIKRVVNNL